MRAWYRVKGFRNEGLGLGGGFLLEVLRANVRPSASALLGLGIELGFGFGFGFGLGLGFG